MTIIYYLVYTRYHNPLNQVVGSVCRYYDEDLMHWRNYDFRIADHISYIERNGIKITEEEAKAYIENIPMLKELSK